MPSKQRIMIKIVAPIVPVTFKRVIPKKGQPFNPKDYSDFKDALGYYALAAMHGLYPSVAPMKITAQIFTQYEPYSLNAGDWDNHAKAISDALNSICYDDDRQIVEGHVYLFKGEPHINIELEELFNWRKSNEIY